MRTVPVRVALCRLGSLLAALVPAAYSAAGTLEVSVIDEGGRPIEDVAVYATPAHPVDHTAAVRAGAAPKAVMDQEHMQFVPHLLVVQAGTEVSFPNGDEVSHHVYSFSETKPFELPLYKGNQAPPQLFDPPGVVVLGYHIHDGLLGYIVYGNLLAIGRLWLERDIGPAWMGLWWVHLAALGIAGLLLVRQSGVWAPTPAAAT